MKEVVDNKLVVEEMSVKAPPKDINEEKQDISESSEVEGKENLPAEGLANEAKNPWKRINNNGTSYLLYS